MEHVHNLIVGGGFTGLTLAQQLPQAGIVTQDVGGLIRNFSRNGFSFDIGGHVYTTSDPRVVEVMKAADGVYHPRREAYYLPYDYETKAVPYPVQAYAGELGIKLKGGKAKNPASLADYITQVFGADFYENWFQPFNRRVWSTDPELMDFDWINGRVQLPSEKKEDWGMNSSFWYAQGNDIIKAMMKATNNDMFFMNGQLFAVDIHKHIASFKTATGSFTQVHYGNLICTTPHFLPHLKRNYVYSIGIGFAGQLDYDFHWAYCRFSSDVHRVTMLSRYHAKNAPAGCDSLLLEIPYFPGEHDNPYARAIVDNALPQEDLFACARRLLESAGFQSATRIPITTVWGANTLGYPIPTTHSRQSVATTKTQLLKGNIYLAGRWGAHLYANLQHVFADVDSVVAQVDCDEPVDNYINSSFYYKK